MGPGRALELIERERVTNFSGVPTMSRELLAHPDWSTRDTSSLLGMAGGGAPVQADLVGKIEKSLEKGSPGTGYGLTETHGIVTANSAGFYVAKPESCGPVVPTLDAKLIDEAGDDLPSGPDSIGRLCVRGSIVIKGYLNRPEATAESIRDGWFDTGDIARIDDDGFVFIVDRAKDMVLRGGENVYCSEVETAIHQHDHVAEAAVFGIPDDRLGDALAALWSFTRVRADEPLCASSRERSPSQDPDPSGFARATPRNASPSSEARAPRPLIGDEARQNPCLCTETVADRIRWTQPGFGGVRRGRRARPSPRCGR